MRRQMSERTAWVWLARQPMTSGMCHTIDDLDWWCRISRVVYERMCARIHRAKRARRSHLRENAWLYSLDDHGHRKRVRFALRQAAQLQRRRKV